MAYLPVNLTNYDASGLAEAIALRRLSVVEVITAHFELIEKLNGKYNALVTLDKVRAMQRAREADADLEQGKSWGPLHGVPITIKDAIETEGLRTTVGYEAYTDFIPAADAWVVTRLKNAGAIVIGKSNCAVLCGDIQTTNEIFGTTNNPWDIGRTSGGSSGGEGAAVALGLSPLGIGSDTAGSIRIPASYCGVFALKPSIGKIPRDGLRPLRDDSHDKPDSLTVVGPLARSVRDLQLCYSVLTGESAWQESDSKFPKIFWTHEFDEALIDDEVAKLLDAKFSSLADNGADVVKVASPIPFGKLWATYMRLNWFEFLPVEKGKTIHALFWFFESIRSFLRGGANAGYRNLKREQAEMSRKVEKLMEGCDCWVLPATPSVAFAHQKSGMPILLQLRGHAEKRFYWDASAAFTYPFNMVGNPSVVIPVGKNDDGLPIAIQVVGKLGDDMKLLYAAAYLATRLGDAKFGCN